MADLIDLTGQRFGKLIVVEKAPTVKRKTYWLCKCDCGEMKIVGANELKRGDTTSCGCLRREHGKRIKDLTGKRFGHLTAVSFDKEKSTSVGRTFWKCTCDCGSVVSVDASTLNNCKGNKSCGCVVFGHKRNPNKTKNVCKTRLYNIWNGMQTRCKKTRIILEEGYLFVKNGLMIFMLLLNGRIKTDMQRI